MSVRSARFIAECLNPALYDVVCFGISKKGIWSQLEGPQDLTVVPERQGAPLTSEILDQIDKCDLMFPVLHGPYGEDGTVQGMFEMLGKAYAGCDHRVSAVCMDKAITKMIASQFQIPTKPFVTVCKGAWRQSKALIIGQIKQSLKFPVFVKPSHYGSSIGIGKVENEGGLEKAISEAFIYDDALVVEEGVENPREIEFAVYGNDKVRAFPPGEVLTGGKIYDYEAKYGDFCFNTTPKAELPEEKVGEGISYARKIFQAVGGRGFVRADFFLDGEQKFWLNELNPIPGFTEISLFPQICKANGIEGDKLVGQLIILGLHRHRRAEAPGKG